MLQQLQKEDEKKSRNGSKSQQNKIADKRNKPSYRKKKTIPNSKQKKLLNIWDKQFSLKIMNKGIDKCWEKLLEHQQSKKPELAKEPQLEDI